jgi:hypothetical protein
MKYGTTPILTNTPPFPTILAIYQKVLFVPFSDRQISRLTSFYANRKKTRLGELSIVSPELHVGGYRLKWGWLLVASASQALLEIKRPMEIGFTTGLFYFGIVGFRYAQPQPTRINLTSAELLLFLLKVKTPALRRVAFC